MITLLVYAVLILVLWGSIKLTGLVFSLFGKLLGLFFSLIGYLIIGVFAVSIIGIAAVTIPIVMIAGVLAIASAIASI